MQVRYRYRIEPTVAQQQMLGRVFGCCRVVFNDALRVRDEAYRAGVKLSDTEIQRRVITTAKTTAERGWLREVPSVALVLAAGRAERLNACGAPVSPPVVQGARGDETGSTPTAA